MGVGSAFIFISYWCVRQLRRCRFMKMVCWSAFCEFMFSGKFLIASAFKLGDSSNHWCLVDGVFAQFFGLGCISWFACIGFDAFRAILWEQDGVVATRSEASIPRYHVFVWSMSIFTTLIAAGHYGATGADTCWIKGARNPLRLLYLGPLAIYMIVNVGYLITVIYKKYRP